MCDRPTAELGNEKKGSLIVLLTLSLTPHIIVWATSKHLVGITNVCIIYFFEKIFNRSKINEKN